MNETPSNPQSETERFLFNLQDFDEAEEEEIEEEDLPPPPPTFSEEQLAAAREEAFAAGKQEGLKESQESREQYVAGVLGELKNRTADIMSTEQARETRFEEEAVMLSLALFTKLFPHYSETCGFEELLENIKIILQKQDGKSAIEVRVHPEAVDGIRAHLDTMQAQGSRTDYTVKGDETLDKGACRMRWEDGGAVRDSRMLAKEIAKAVAEVLEARATNSHDKEEQEPVQADTQEETQEQTQDEIKAAQENDKSEGNDNDNDSDNEDS